MLPRTIPDAGVRLTGYHAVPLPPTAEPPMSLTMHAASVPVFQQMLAALGGVLAKAETFAVERKIDPAALL